MPEIKPFRGILYNQQHVNLSDVVAPPYDVISAEQQNQLYDKNPYNVVRLILGREADRYASAATFFELWKEKKILVDDETASLYILSQQFDNTTYWLYI